MKIKEKAKEKFNRFGIEILIETNKKGILERIRTFFEPISTGDMSEMVTEGKPLPIPDIFYTFAKDYEQFLDIMSPERLFEFIMEAREDLGMAIMETPGGAEYMVMLRAYIVAKIEQTRISEEAISQEIKEGKTKLVTCDNCGYQELMTPEDAANLTACPQCGDGGEPAPPAEENQEPKTHDETPEPPETENLEEESTEEEELPLQEG